MAAVYDSDQLEQKEREEKATDDKVGDHEDLSRAEQTAEDLTQHENQVGQGYRKKSNVAEGPSLARKLFVIHRRKTIAGGSIIGLIIGILFGFSVLQGPFQFLHLAQLLQRFHFNSLEEQTDVRSFRLMRFIKSGGNAQEARVGAIASRLGNKMEARFNAAGFKYISEGPAKFFGGFEIDRDNPKFKGRSDADIRQELAKEGIPTEIRDGKIVAPAKESYRQNRLLTESMMKRVGYSKISSAIQSRAVAGKWFGFARWHPMRPVDARINLTLGEYWKLFKQKFNERVGKGSYGVEGGFFGEKRDIIDCEPDCTPEDKAYNEEARKYNAEIERQEAEYNKKVSEVRDDARGVNGEDNRERPSKTRELAERSRLKLIGGSTAVGAASATAVLCIVNDFNRQYEALKQDRIIFPLIREGLELIAVGNQSMNGQDADLDQLGAYSQLLDDDTTGSWRNAASIQAELGEKSSRQPTEDEIDQKNNLANIDRASPFAGFINGLPGGSGAVDGICGPVGQIVAVVLFVPLAIFTGGTSALVSLAAQSIAAGALTPIAINYFASLLAGTTVDPYAEGAIFGNNVNYGSRLAASGINVSRGGKELSDREAQELAAITQADVEQEFASRSVAHRLFNPYDTKSALAKLIDAPDPELTGNFAKISKSIFSIRGLFSSVQNLFASKVKAATPLPYDYGFPEFGFAAGEIDNEAVYNPYDNAAATVKLLEGASGPAFIERAKNCFGVSIAKTPVSGGSPAWGVTHTDDAPNPYNKTDDSYSKWNCGDGSTDWLRIRFFIYDTTTMDAISCYEEDDQESCNNVGFGATTLTSTGGGDSCTSTVDQSPGKPDKYVGAISQYAPGLSRPECNFSIPSGAVPDDGRQYFAAYALVDPSNPPLCDGNDLRDRGGSRYPGHRCIAVKYRDPPGSGNTVVIPID